ncbi:MAG: N-acetylmuramoyl-L-alanine amidase [Clostridia bacterium]|nr:N-acetylmuramoyl-L-alanine amidase [Clostridia bacterium]
MKIYDTDFNWSGNLLTRPLTRKIIIHHRAGAGDVLSLHNTHLKNGWSGIGYHFYIRKDGSIYRGRPIEKMGAHAEGNNMDSVGVCFEGNFEKDIMEKAQIESGKLLIGHIQECYGRKLEIAKHSDYGTTLCPGKNFPFNEIKKVSCDNVVTKMFDDGVITLSNINNWELFLSGKARPKAEYIKTVIKRYQSKIV